MRPEAQQLGVEMWEAGIELGKEIGQERQGPAEQRKACFQQAGSTEVGCANMALGSDLCLELIQNDDIVTVAHTVTVVQMSAKQPSQQEMSDAVDIEIEIAVVDSTVVIVYESAEAKCRQGEVTMEFRQALDNLSDSAPLEEPIESPIESILYRHSAAAGRA